MCIVERFPNAVQRFPTGRLDDFVESIKVSDRSPEQALSEAQHILDAPAVDADVWRMDLLRARAFAEEAGASDDSAVNERAIEIHDQLSAELCGYPTGIDPEVESRRLITVWVQKLIAKWYRCIPN